MQLFAIIEDDTYNSVRERQSRDGTSIHAEVDSLLRAGLDATERQSEEARRFLEHAGWDITPEGADATPSAAPGSAEVRDAHGDVAGSQAGSTSETPDAGEAREPGMPAGAGPTADPQDRHIPAVDGSGTGAAGLGPEGLVDAAPADGRADGLGGACEGGDRPGERVMSPREMPSEQARDVTLTATPADAADGLEAAEERILDAMQIDPEARAGAIAALVPEDFDDINRRRLFEVIRSMAAVGRHIDYGTVGTCAQIYFPNDCYGIREAQLALPKGISPVVGWPVDVSAIVAARAEVAEVPAVATGDVPAQPEDADAASGSEGDAEPAPRGSDGSGEAASAAAREDAAAGDAVAAPDDGPSEDGQAGGAAAGDTTPADGAVVAEGAPQAPTGGQEDQEGRAEDGREDAAGARPAGGQATHDPQLVARALAHFDLRPAEDSGGEWGTVAVSQDGEVSVVEVMWNEDGTGRASIDPNALGAVSAVERARARSYLRAHEGLGSVGVSLLSLSLGDGKLDAALWRDAIRVDRES